MFAVNRDDQYDRCERTRPVGGFRFDRSQRKQFHVVSFRMNVSAISAIAGQPLRYVAGAAINAKRPNASGESTRDPNVSNSANHHVAPGVASVNRIVDQLDISSANAVRPLVPTSDLAAEAAADIAAPLVSEPQSILRTAETAKPEPAAKPSAKPTTAEQPTAEQSTAEQSTGTGELSEEEQEQVDELKERDREVRTHEQAHKAAAGPHARGGPTYEYQRGPDGQNYAVGGSVDIDTSPVKGDPEATIQKAQVVRAAALAPAEPSAQDRKVAAAASRMLAEAQSDLIAEKMDSSTSKSSTSKFSSAKSSSAAASAYASSDQDVELIDAGSFLDLLA